MIEGLLWIILAVWGVTGFTLAAILWTVISTIWSEHHAVPKALIHSPVCQLRFPIACAVTADLRNRIVALLAERQEQFYFHSTISVTESIDATQMVTARLMFDRCLNDWGPFYFHCPTTEDHDADVYIHFDSTNIRTNVLFGDILLKVGKFQYDDPTSFDSLYAWVIGEIPALLQRVHVEMPEPTVRSGIKRYIVYHGYRFLRRYWQ